MKAHDKPPYRVPLMSEVRSIPRNGFRIVSTFSGCGGSCLGFKMDGYEVLWANEFIPAARETYAANHEGTILDPRDIRSVSPDDIMRETGTTVGEVDVFEGSPPCASFSTAGKREKGWGQVRKYSDSKQRVDDLFFQYTRLLRGLQPRTFIAENVAGLVKGTAKGYFKEIFAALKDCGYSVACQVLDAQWLGVPQMRQRVIFQGIRRDLADKHGLKPCYPKPLPYRYSIKDALPNLRRLVHDTGGQFSEGNVTDRPSPTVMTKAMSHFKVEDETWLTGKLPAEFQKLRRGQQHPERFNMVRSDEDKPSPTIAAMWGKGSGIHCVTHPSEPRKFSIAELKRVCSFPDDFVFTGTFAQQWERMGRSVPPLMMRAVARALREGVLERMRGS